MRRPTMAHMAPAFSLKAALGWFDLLLATLDCYTWTFGETLLSPAKVLLGKFGPHLNSHITEAQTSLALSIIWCIVWCEMESQSVH